MSTQNILKYMPPSTAVHGSIIHNRQNAETAQMSADSRADKQNVVFLYNGVLLGHRKECSTDMLQHATTWMNLGNITVREES